ncbi:MAG: hypothetical protein EZS28_028312 [Streblomastix strix]|uniref:Uncharacterized protein n=1 Tax=Streblomastix strix TaxID=222440 RepID=A0A5J4V260_9EUKA|nr:MAG: hypothetical protein EZS28_028312 [Streblomastix strix]
MNGWTDDYVELSGTIRLINGSDKRSELSMCPECPECPECLECLECPECPESQAEPIRDLLLTIMPQIRVMEKSIELPQMENKTDKTELLK